MPTKSVFLQVAEAIGDRVKTIDGTGAWQTDIGLKTQVGRFTFIKSDLSASALVFYVDSTKERDNPPATHNSGMSATNWQRMRWVVCASLKRVDNENALLAVDRLACDLTKAIFGSSEDTLLDMTFGGLLIQDGGLQMVNDMAMEDPFKTFAEVFPSEFAIYTMILEGVRVRNPWVA